MTPQALANSYRERSNGDTEAALDAACAALIEARVALDALAGNVSAGFQRLTPVTPSAPATMTAYHLGPHIARDDT